MARPKRSDFEGAVHHVYGRGNNRQPIFRDEQDYRTYLARLLFYKVELGAAILAYCLMPNHYHLVVQTGKIALEAFMQRLNTSYTRLFNDRWLTVGHLFQGRYLERRCKTDAETMAAIRYVHMNPVEAGLCAAPQDWPWSSDRGIRAGDDPIADVSETLELFGGQAEYAAFMAAPLKKHQRRPLAELFAAYPLSDQELMTGSSRTTEAGSLRRAFLVEALALGFRAGDVAKILRRSPSAVSQLLRSAHLNSQA